MEITLSDLKRVLPNPDESKPTDEYYLTLAKYIDKLWTGMHAFPEIDEPARQNTVISLVAYYQDIVADAGIWRAFVQMCRSLYGKPVPFYEEPADYIDFELNLTDVQFIVWYALEARLGFQGLVSPFDDDLMRLSRQVFKLFDFLYEDAPAPDDYKPLFELDLDDREQVRDIFRMSGWLFWNSYFLRPVSKHAYEREIGDDEELTVEETLTDEQRLRTTFEQPTGPLALTVEEWMRLIVDNRLPATDTPEKTGKEHDYFLSLAKATGGKAIAFCKNYEDLTGFLSEKMGWECDENGHFPALKAQTGFVLYADRQKGLLIAHSIAPCIKSPDNPLYDAAYASLNAHRLVMEPAACPIDLLKFLMSNGMLPDAKYPAGKNGEKLLRENWDFLARMYLRNFYRAD